MKSAMKLVLTGILIVVLNLGLKAQKRNLFNQSTYKLGALFGYGGLYNTWPRYEVLFFQFQFSYSILNKRNWGIEILTVPQYNLTRYRYSDFLNKGFNGYEFVLNAGCLIRRNLFTTSLVYMVLLERDRIMFQVHPNVRLLGIYFLIMLLLELILGPLAGFTSISDQVSVILAMQACESQIRESIITY